MPATLPLAAEVAALQKWLKALPLARRPLVKSSVWLMTEEGAALLQMALPPPPPHAPPPVEYENAPPALLLPPYRPAPNAIKLSIQVCVLSVLPVLPRVMYCTGQSVCTACPGGQGVQGRMDTLQLSHSFLPSPTPNR